MKETTSIAAAADVVREKLAQVEAKIRRSQRKR